MWTIIKRLVKNSWLNKYRWKRIHEKRQVELNEYKKRFLEERDEMYSCFCKALNEENLVFWLDFGTLLGYYRDHDFIKHDVDIDMGTYLTNATKVKEALERNGFKRVRHYYPVDHSGLEEAYKFRHISIDVFYYVKQDKIMHSTGYRPLSPIKKSSLLKPIPMKVMEYTLPYSGFHIVEYKGSHVYVPNDIVSHLKMNYGESFMTPNPQWNELKDSTNIRFYSYEERPAEGFFIEKWI